MKQRIFKSMCVLSLSTILISFIMISIVLYNTFYQDTRDSLRQKGWYIAAGLNSDPDNYLPRLDALDNEIRITLIDQDGSILYDNRTDEAAMENHNDRPEVEDALENGEGENVRMSETLDTKTIYYAIRLDNGMVVRVAESAGSALMTVMTSAPFLALIILATFLASLFYSVRTTRRIVDPINNLKLDRPLNNDIYEEFQPLLNRINNQNIQIRNQLKELKESREEFTSITNHMQEGLIILNDKSCILSINDSACRLLHAQGRSLSGTPVSELTSEIDFQEISQLVLKGRSEEKIFLLDNKYYQVLANPVYTGETVKGVVLLILDITESYNSEHMRREFSANVSHELKTPLTSISGYAELMQSGMVKPEDVQVFSGRIYKEARRLIDLVEDIMKLSQLDEQASSFPVENIDLYEMAEDICDRLASVARKKDVTMAIDGERLSISGVRQIIDEMMFNLCDNAIKYNVPGGSVTISLRRKNGLVILSVSDTGIGIAKIHHDRIFERFYRVDKSHSRQTGGTGLGLSIVKHGAQYHNASIKLKSKPGKGTKISIYFPD